MYEHLDKRLNQLYPIFLRMNLFETLIVGGGAVALEKLSFLLKSSPNARVKMVSKTFDQEILEIAQGKDVKLFAREFESNDINGMQLVIAATDNLEVNRLIHQLCKSNNILVNVADTPDLCNFYLGGIVTKGPIKIAISTNGTSPTLAKRLRQILEETLPSDLEDLAHNLDKFRKTLKGNFAEKVERLNELTKSLIH